MSPAAIPVVEPGQKLPAFSKLKALFAYDTSEPFDTSLGDFPTEELGATFTPISYSVNGGQAAGYLVLPEGEGPFPVVVYAPGHGDEFGVSRWNRTAARLTKQGYAGLLLEESGGPFWKLDGQGDVRAFQEYVHRSGVASTFWRRCPRSTVNASASSAGAPGRSSADSCRASTPASRPSPLTVCTTGTPPRGRPTIRGWRSSKADGVSPEAYAAQMSIVDPAVYLSRNKGAAFLFLWGKEGDAASASLQRQFVAAAGPRASVFMHSRGHGIWPDGRRALEAWIVKNL